MKHASRRCVRGMAWACGFLLWAAPIHAQSEGSAASSADDADDATREARPADAATPEAEAPEDERARAHFKVGQSLYAAGRFEEAAEEWQQAYELSDQPELLYNMYLAYRDSNQQREAADALRGYLEKAQSVPSDLRVTLEARLRVMEKSLQKRKTEAEQAPEATANEGDEARPSTTQASPVRVPPRQPAGPASETTPVWREIAPWAVIGVGGAMVLAGVVTGVAAVNRIDDIEEACPEDRCPQGFDLDDARGDASALVTATDVLIIGGGLVAAGGVAWLLWDASREGRQAEGPTVSLGCGSQGCTASLAGRF